MKNRILFPSTFRPIGFVILMAGIALFIAWNNYGFQFAFLKVKPTPKNLDNLFKPDNYTGTLVSVITIIGLLFVAFARQKTEDEMVQHIRLSSLMLSLYITLAVFILLVLFTYSVSFAVYSMYLWYVFLMLFCIIFYTRMFLINKGGAR